MTAELSFPLRLVGHIGIPGAAPFVAMGLFFAGMGGVVGAYRLIRSREHVTRMAGYGVGALAVGCFVAATALPVIIHATPTFTRPSTTGRLRIVQPRPGEVYRGDPASIPVDLHLTGGRIVPTTSLHLIPNAGHIHLYLDGSLQSMTGLAARIGAPPGRHTLRAEFVAVDHAPFHPRVVATVTFRVRA